MKRRTVLRTMGIGASIGAAAATACSVHAPSVVSGKKRILVAEFSDETNTFIPHHLTLDEVKQSARYGADILARGNRMVHGTYGGCIDGFADFMEMFDIELVGSIDVGGNHRLMTGEVFDYVTGYILDSLDNTPVDAVYMSMHGGGCTEGHDDLEGDTLELIRRKVGTDIPIVYTFDLHSALTDKMVQMGDAVSIYRTYPHVDAYECGYEIAAILLGTLQGKLKPVQARRWNPLMIGPPLNVVTADQPMKTVYDRAKMLQRFTPGVLACCPAHGFMQQDIPTQGSGVMVTCDRDRELAQKLADELGELMFSFRKEFWVDLPNPEETIRMAMKPNPKPYAVADSGDNIGAGGAGDGTALLREILRQGTKSAFVQIYDPEATQKAVEAGLGTTLSLDIGGKSDPLYGPPVSMKGTVAYLSKEGDPWHPAVRFDANGITILLNSKLIGPDDQTNVRAMGIQPETFKIVICKGGFAFRPQHPPQIYDYILSATPGYSSPDLSSFTWKRIPRPMYPLDDI